jgi:hypothetical protein
MPLEDIGTNTKFPLEDTKASMKHTLRHIDNQ